MKKKKVANIIKARLMTFSHNSESFTVPMANSYRFFACDCDPSCGNVNFILEDENERPFSVAQLSYEQILGPLTEAALEARTAVGEKTN